MYLMYSRNLTLPIAYQSGCFAQENLLNWWTEFTRDLSGYLAPENGTNWWIELTRDLLEQCMIM